MMVYDIIGEFDIFVIVKFKDRVDMNRFVKWLLLFDGVEKMNMSVVMQVVKEELRLFFEDQDFFEEFFGKVLKIFYGKSYFFFINFFFENKFFGSYFFDFVEGWIFFYCFFKNFCEFNFIDFFYYVFYDYNFFVVFFGVFKFKRNVGCEFDWDVQFGGVVNEFFYGNFLEFYEVFNGEWVFFFEFFYFVFNVYQEEYVDGFCIGLVCQFYGGFFGL